MIAVAAGIATCLPIGAAIAQGRDNDRHDNGRPRGPELRREQSRQHDWQREHWRNGYRGNGREYSRRPDIYYSAPPVVVMPPRYYQPPPPGLSLQFGFPLYY
jgi:hypothetical protein